MMKFLEKYGLLGAIYMIYCWIITRLFYHKARIIRFPFDLRGSKYINLGEGLTLGKYCRFEVFPHLMVSDERYKIMFGKNVQINDNVHICAMKSVKIGDNVLMASHVFISDNSHGSYAGDERDSSPDTPPTERLYSTAPVRIGDNCWIGEGVIIMPGVEIGYGCIIGAHSVVNSNIPDRTIAVGAPARVVKIWDSVEKHWVSV